VGREIRVMRGKPDLRSVPEPLASELREVQATEVPRRVVGVVEDVRMAAVQGRAGPVVYTEYRQQDRGFWYGSLEPRFVVRARPGAIVPLDRVSTVLRSEGAGGEVVQAADLRDLLERAIGARGALALLSSSGFLFTVIAALLVGIGVYGVLAETVNRREMEWGVRMALGAGPWGIAGELAREVVPLLAAGLALGLAGSVAGNFVIAALVVSRSVQASTWLLAGAALAITVGAAVVVPLRRVFRLDPVRLLRSN